MWRGVTELPSQMGEHRWRRMENIPIAHPNFLLPIACCLFSLLAQVVTYKVYPVRGYEAKVSYEGTAQVES